MITSPRTPPLLAPYVVLPQPGSLTLVTGVLGATPNWLVLRFLAVALVDLGPDDRCKAHVHPAGDGWDQGEDEVRIVLVSFSKDWAFWKGEGVRTVRCESPLSLHAFLGEGVQLGIDFVRHLKNGRVTFVDGLSKLFTDTNTPQAANSERESGQRVLSNPNLDVVERTVLDAIEESKHGKSSLERKRTLLFLDGLDLYIAATGRSPKEVNDMLEEWREYANSTSVSKQVYATIIATAADSPFVQSPITPLETAHTAFVVGLAHEAGLVMSVRALDTGVARDISGVIRIVKASGWPKADKHVQASQTSPAEAVEEREMLYFIAGDGGIRVWERGA
ncbi:hypothetical protein MMC15_008152 [Xylographa vitiligo]|nr:hypothetical protein [Xylographa vitiligo]